MKEAMNDTSSDGHGCVSILSTSGSGGFGPWLSFTDLAPGSSECCTPNGTPAFEGVCAKSQPLVQIPPSVWPEDRQKETMPLGCVWGN